MWDQGSKGCGSGIRGVRSGVTVSGSGITSHGIGDQHFFFLRDQGSGCSCSIFVGSGACICHAFDIKDQKYGYKKGISDEKKHTS